MHAVRDAPNRKRPLYKPGKPMPRPESWAIRLAWGRRINYAASLGWASSGQIRCQSDGRRSWRVTAPSVACSMATQFTGSGDVPLARQLLTADCEMPIAAASLPTPPHKSIALSSGLMQLIISQVIANVNTAVIGCPHLSLDLPQPP